jgi:hypothetical protein
MKAMTFVLMGVNTNYPNDGMSELLKLRQSIDGRGLNVAPTKRQIRNGDSKHWREVELNNLTFV